MERIRSFFIGHHLTAAEDEFEKAKIKLVFSFFSFFFIISVIFIPYLFTYKIPTFTYVNLSLYSLYLLSFVVLKVARTHETASFLMSFSIMLSAAVNSVCNNGLLTPNISVWFFVAVAFCAYVTRLRYTIALVVVMYAFLSVIDWLKYHDRLFLNPYFSEKANLDATPLIMVVSFPLIVMLFVAYVRSKRRAISSFKSTLEEKDKILGKVAHDLRNPIGAAVSCIELYKMKKPEADESEIDRFLDLALNSCERALGHIEDLLDAAALRDDSAQVLIVEQSALSPFVQSIAEGYMPRALKKGIHLSFQTADEKIVASINTLRFSRVIDNVISNAVKFTGEGGHIEVEVKGDADDAVIRISDNGIGIPARLQGDLFREFTPSARRGTGNERSSGLGMSITQKIVKLHHGRIEFESEEGKGTTFYISIPRCKDVKEDSGENDA